MLRIYCDKRQDLNHLMQDTLLSNPAVARIQSQIVMDHTKAAAPILNRLLMEHVLFQILIYLGAAVIAVPLDARRGWDQCVAISRQESPLALF